MVLWAVLTPLVLFLVLVPGYVVATYVKHRMTVSKEKPKRLLGNACSSSYYTNRSTIRERLQERSSLNVPSAVKPTTKHLRSSSSAGMAHVPATKSLILQQPQTKRQHFRRNSSPVSVLLTPQHQPEIMETYSPYQIRSAPASCDEKSPEETPRKFESSADKLSTDKSSADKRSSDTNNNGKQYGRRMRPRHLTHPESPVHFYATATGTYPFLIHSMKMEPLRETLKVDLPEILDKP